MSRSARPLTWVVIWLLATLGADAALMAEEPAAAPDLLLILDASGSMWGQIEGENKIVIARRVVTELLGGGVAVEGRGRAESVVSVDSGRSVGQGRTYTSDKSNPMTFELTPGKYRLGVEPVKGGDLSPREVEVTIEAGETVERMVDCSQ